MLIQSGLRLITLVLCFFVVAACTGDPTANAPKLYTTACATCHTEGVGLAPIPGDKADWAKRTTKGIEKLYDNAINGFEGDVGIMPARGSRPDLTDDDIKAIVDWMVEVSQ
jgi:cytochrome c5